MIEYIKDSQVELEESHRCIFDIGKKVPQGIFKTCCRCALIKLEKE